MSPGLARIEAWFASRGWTPFPFQREAWAAYRDGRSGLINAPTGVGKSYAAFMGPLSERIDAELADTEPGSSVQARFPSHA
ncbi:MAG: hypothetical protein H7Y88_13115, partial [Phycisphaerales bacterium]|nr:hypothetical protein [Phycisphaerales bacterium]